MLTILDVRNFWSRAADDARRDQADTLAFMRERADLRYIQVRPGGGTWTEVCGSALVEHVEQLEVAQQLSADWSVVSGQRLRELVQLYRPDVIECGSPAILPFLVQLAAARLDPRPALIGRWQADLAGDEVGPRLAQIDRRLAQVGERATRWWTQSGYASFDAVFVASPAEARQLAGAGLDRLYLTRPGVDAGLFGPSRRDPALVAQLQAGVETRPIVWVDAEPERIGPLYAALCRRSSQDPALVLAHGDDPVSARLAGARTHVHAPSFGSADDRARWLASCDLALCSTGAIGCLEAMASGLAVVSDRAQFGGRRAAELVRDSRCGAISEPGPEAVAEALSKVFRDPERAQLGQRGRAHSLAFEHGRARERALLSTREVLEHVRAGRRVPAGIHELLRPAELSGAESS